jgi:hypothetical protein
MLICYKNCYRAFAFLDVTLHPTQGGLVVRQLYEVLMDMIRP